ncbi:Uncharacterised protein [Mycobacteroides abscessus subsp. abscessus]|nr:Uncharacterised protein [Mycobacteroides abscessus subsp. abscessus]
MLGSAAHGPDDVADVGGEHDGVEDDEPDDGEDEVGGGEVGDGILGAQTAVDDPRLAPGLCGHPAADDREDPHGCRPHADLVEAVGGEEAPAQAGDDAGHGDAEEDHRPVEHQPEAPERHPHRRLQVRIGFDVVQAGKEVLAGEILSDEGAEEGHLDVREVLLVGLVGDDEEVVAVAVRLPVSLDRRELGHLVFDDDLEGDVIADGDLDGQKNREDADRHRERALREGQRTAADEVPRGDADDEGRCGDEDREEHVEEAQREGRVEDDLEPVRRHEGAVVGDGEPGRGLHPRVRGEDPRRRQQGADRDEEGGDEHRPLLHPPVAVEEDADESGFDEERGDDLHRDDRSDDRTGDPGEHTPVESELEGEHGTGDDAEGEADPEDPPPESEHLQVDRTPGLPVQPVDDGEEHREPHRHRREHDVEDRGERELQPGEVFEGHRPRPPRRVRRRMVMPSPVQSRRCRDRRGGPRQVGQA